MGGLKQDSKQAETRVEKRKKHTHNHKKSAKACRRSAATASFDAQPSRHCADRLKTPKKDTSVSRRTPRIA